MNADDGKRVGHAYKFSLVPEFQNTLFYSLGEVFEGGKIRQVFGHQLNSMSFHKSITLDQKHYFNKLKYSRNDNNIIKFHLQF